MTATPPTNEAFRAFERLQIITRSNAFVQQERQWLERLEIKLRTPIAMAARKVGFGPWRKHHADPAQLVAALDKAFRPLLEQHTHIALPEARPTDAPDTFFFDWTALSGDPPLHPELEVDGHAYHLTVSHDDIKHVAHRYVACLGHGLIRQVVADKRTEGDEVVSQRTSLSAQQLYAFEVNLCQYYVPSSTVAYFDKQPMRAFAWDLANRFRKVAFGGQ